ncbi:hypothetical protein A0H81_04370 [Grifola frondosa]|uniref:DUF6533 domain-containing protein n=1 Tax=Grifola frondosa TaxID=5627 RepID=A0A1C7MK39_GRIFR|nr:hypothetical protein A0H81_04370 [Grifola frondosa]
MSSGSANADEEAAIIQLIQSALIENYCLAAAAALLVFDYMVTFDREVYLIWKRKTTGATILFMLNRYIIILAFIVAVVETVRLTDKSGLLKFFLQSCHDIFWFVQVFDLLPYIVWAAFSSLRAYALSDYNRPLAATILVFGLAPVGVNLYSYTQDSPVNLFYPVGCIAFDDIPVATSTGILIIFNALHMYFAISQNASYVIEFEEPMTAILVSRFLLNLREVDRAMADDIDPESPSFSVTLRFASSFVNPLGAPLDHGFSFPEANIGAAACEDNNDIDPEGDMEGGDAGPSADPSRGQLNTIPIWSVVHLL